MWWLAAAGVAWVLFGRRVPAGGAEPTPTTPTAYRATLEPGAEVPGDRTTVEEVERQ